MLNPKSFTIKHGQISISLTPETAVILAQACDISAQEVGSDTENNRDRLLVLGNLFEAAALAAFAQRTMTRKSLLEVEGLVESAAAPVGRRYFQPIEQ